MKNFTQVLYRVKFSKAREVVTIVYVTDDNRFFVDKGQQGFIEISRNQVSEL